MSVILSGTAGRLCPLALDPVPFKHWSVFVPEMVCLAGLSYIELIDHYP